MFDDMRHVDAIELPVFERPGVSIEIPHFIYGIAGEEIDADGIGLNLTLAASHIQNHLFNVAHCRLQ